MQIDLYYMINLMEMAESLSFASYLLFSSKFSNESEKEGLVLLGKQ